MHGNPMRPTISFCNWFQHDKFIAFKTEQYRIRLQELNNTLDQRHSGQADKAALYTTVRNLVTTECKKQFREINYWDLNEQQCREILQNLHANLNESYPEVRQLLNDAPFKTVTNPFTDGRAKAKIAVLFAGSIAYFREQKNQESSQPILMGGIQQQNPSNSIPADVETGFHVPTSEQQPEEQVTIHQQRPTGDVPISQTSIPLTVTVVPTSSVTSLPKVGPLLKPNGLLTIGSVQSRTVPTSAINYPDKVNHGNREFLDAAIANGWLTAAIVADAVEESRLSTVITLLKYMTRDNTIAEGAINNEPSHTFTNLFGTSPDVDTERFSSVLRTLARTYLVNFAKENPEDDFILKAYQHSVRYLMGQLNSSGMLRVRPTTRPSGSSAFELLERVNNIGRGLDGPKKDGFMSPTPSIHVESPKVNSLDPSADEIPLGTAVLVGHWRT